MDVSPPRKRSQDMDVSPPRKRGQQDISPPRKRHQDISPPRKREHNDNSPRIKEEPDASPPRKKTHGLFLGTEGIAAEQKKRQDELEAIRKTDPRKLGMGAATVHRDAKGRPLAMLNQMLAGPDYKGPESNMRWGVGEVDEEEQRREAEDIEKESQRGFHAVYKEDLYQDRELQARDRFGDPMSKLVKKKTKVRTFKGAYPANRFNIPPGWRWDGIDRSNGFESSIFKAANTRKANAEEEMYYAQDDM